MTIVRMDARDGWHKCLHVRQQAARLKHVNTSGLHEVMAIQSSSYEDAQNNFLPKSKRLALQDLLVRRRKSNIPCCMFVFLLLLSIRRAG